MTGDRETAHAKRVREELERRSKLTTKELAAKVKVDLVLIGLARMLSGLVERVPLVSTPIGEFEPSIAAGIGDAMGELIDADREERLPASDGRGLDDDAEDAAKRLRTFITTHQPHKNSDAADAWHAMNVLLDQCAGIERDPMAGLMRAALSAIVDHGYMGSGSSRAAAVHVMDWMVDTAAAGLGGRPVPELTDGPTEGASDAEHDAALLHEYRSASIAWSALIEIETHIRDHVVVDDAHLVRPILDSIANVRERRPTGGASPEPGGQARTAARPDDAQCGDPGCNLCHLDINRGTAAGDLALQIAPVLTRQRDRAQGKLDALIGAVEEGSRMALVVAQDLGPITMASCALGSIAARLRAALDAAKAD